MEFHQKNGLGVDFVANWCTKVRMYQLHLCDLCRCSVTNSNWRQNYSRSRL